MSSVEKRIIKKAKNLMKEQRSINQLYEQLEELEKIRDNIVNAIHSIRCDMENEIDYFIKKDAYILEETIEVEEGEFIDAFFINLDNGHEWIGLYNGTVVKAKAYPGDKPKDKVGLALVKTRLRLALLENKYF